MDALQDKRHSIFGNIQVLRFIAAFFVLQNHGVYLSRFGTGNTLLGAGHLENFGAVGVDIFFVISGFIITRTGFLADRVAPAEFMRRRIIRVVPIYFLMSVPWIFIKLKADVSWDVWVATFLFWPVAGPHPVMPALAVGWTLCFEMLFYVGAGILLTLPRGPISIAAILSVFVGMAFLRLIWNVPTLQFLGNPIILEFLFGVVLALLLEKLNRKLGYIAGLIAALWLAVVLYFGPGHITEATSILDASLSFHRVILFGVPSALIVTSALALETFRSGGPFKRLLSFLGDASYSIYLVHSNVILLLSKVFKVYPVNKDFIIVVTMLISPVAGALAYRFVEKPMIKFLSGLGQKRQALA